MILIINTCNDSLSELEFIAPLQKIVGKCKVVHFSTMQKKDVIKADKIIISGTALADFEYLKADWSWLKKIKKPVLGICAGMQVIAKEFGAVLVNKTSIGVKQVEVIKKNPLADGSENAYFLHTKIGSGNFEVIAQSEDGPAMIKHREKPIFGCAFHPEVMNKGIIERFMMLPNT